jgi:hypothetical protein
VDPRCEAVCEPADLSFSLGADRRGWDVPFRVDRGFKDECVSCHEPFESARPTITVHLANKTSEQRLQD